MRFRGENPVYSRVDYGSAEYTDSATYKGVASKTILLLLIASFVAYYFAMNNALDLSLGTMIAYLVVAPITAFIMIILAHKNTQMAWLFSILYAIFEGVFLGMISMIVSYQVGGDAVIYALSGTFVTMFVMLILYSTRIVKVSSGFVNFLFTSLISIIVISLLFVLLSLTGIFSSSVGMGLYTTIVIVSVVISSLYLLYDFKRINEYVDSGASKEIEWSLGLGLMVTLVWLYIELLRLALIVMRKR